MEPQRLYLEGGKPTEVHICGKCRRVWENHDAADRCCRCSYCREYCSWEGGTTTHRDCFQSAIDSGEAKTLAKAELVADYDGPFLLNDRFYRDTADLLEAIEGDGSGLPEYGFCAKYEAPCLDEEAIIEQIRDRMHEDWEPEDSPELTAGIAAWNAANAGNGSYWEDRKRKWSRAALLAVEGV